VSIEAVVAARPQVVLAARADLLRMWDRWSPCCRGGHRYVLEEDLLIPPRLPQGAAALCATLDTARHSLGLTLD
jgi:iron complex transport system substrate-binding protein/vitamin B12 transport system substrate-binding protein